MFEVGLLLLSLERPAEAVPVRATLLLPFFSALQLQRALRKPGEGLAPTLGEGERLFGLADAPWRGSFCCLCRKASAGQPEGTTALLGAGWALFFSLPLLPFRKHILLFLPSVFASGGKEVRKGPRGWEPEPHPARGPAPIYSFKKSF